jgi:Glycosyl transferases group 1.
LAFRATIVSKVVPVEPAPHGGARVLAEHCRALSRLGAEVTVIAPDEARNTEAVPGDLCEVALYSQPRQAGNGLALLRDKARSVWFPGEAPVSEMASFAASRDVCDAVQRADYLEFSWVENAGLVKAARSIGATAPTGLFCHDVLTQRYRREFDAERNPAVRAARWVRWSRSIRRQTAVYGAADVVWVLSDKDQAVLSAGLSSRTRVLPPAVADSGFWSARLAARREKPVVVFVGALSRSENADGLVWFVEHCWPLVLRSVPDAELQIVGSGADALPSEVGLAENARLLGFVDDLGDVYAHASVAVAPLLRGAGVKIKAVETMCADVPSVGTEVGMEGIPWAGVRDLTRNSAPSLAKLIATILHNPDDAERTARDAGQWAREYFSRDSYDARLARGLHAIGLNV